MHSAPRPLSLMIAGTSDRGDAGVDQGVLAGAGAGAGAPPSRPRAVGHEQGPPRGQGVRGLEPERPAQDDRERVLAARDAAADGLHAADVGRGRGGRRVRRSGELVFTSADVLERVAEHGDLFAPVATLEQELPARRGGAGRRRPRRRPGGRRRSPAEDTSMSSPTSACASSADIPVTITRAPSSRTDGDRAQHAQGDGGVELRARPSRR